MGSSQADPPGKIQADASERHRKRFSSWRWRLVFLFGAAGIAFAIFFNSSTRYGRWLFWQDADWGDIDRFPARAIQHDPKRVSAFADGSIDAVAQTISALRFADKSVVDMMEENDSTAFIVIHDNRIVLEKYFQGNERGSLQSTFSCTKSFLSVLIGQAIKNGQIGSVDDCLNRYLKNLDPSVGEIKMGELLSMTSGIGDSKAKLFGVDAPWSDKVVAYYEPDFRNFSPSIRLAHTPGSRFEYHDFNPLLAGMALEAATGKSPSELLKIGVWDRIGAEYDAKWSLDHGVSGLEKTEAGLHLRAIDMARFGSALIRKDNPLVSEEWWHQSTQESHGPGPEGKWHSRADSLLAEGKISPELHDYIKNRRYGYFWWIVNANSRIDFYANGRFGQFIYVSPSARLVIVRCGPSHGKLDDIQFGYIFSRIAAKVLSSQ